MPLLFGAADTTDSSGSSSSSSNGGHTDGESLSGSTSPDEVYPEPPSISQRHRNHKSELEEDPASPRVQSIVVAPSSPLLPTSRPHLSTSLKDHASPIHTSPCQIPDEEGLQVEISHINQETDSLHTGSDDLSHSPDPWGQPLEGECQWGNSDVVATWTELQDPPPAYPPLAESGEDLMTLSSSDQQMTLTLRNFLGAGSYGKVVSADWAEGHRQVAVKVSHKLFISELDCTESGLKNLKNELDVLKVLKQSREDRELGSNFFPELFKSWQDAKNVYFAMEMYPWNLEDLRWADSTWDATPGDKLLWTAEMVCPYTWYPLPSCSHSTTDSWCSGSSPHANPTPRHQAIKYPRHVHETPRHQ